MKKFIFLILLFSSNLTSKELLLRCENGFSYKISYSDNSNIISYYKTKNDWIEVKNFRLKNDSIELFIPNKKYIPCTDNSLPICKYSILISEVSTNRPSTSEVVLNDCFIGTMGCNEYKKGLNLNKSYCTRLNE